MKIQSTPPPPPPANRKGLAFGAFLVAATLLSLAPPEQSQAQLVINVYPSQDTPTNTIWIFSGSSTAQSSSSIRTSGIYESQDSWRFADHGGNFYNANAPNNQTIPLSPLFSSTNAIDMESIRKRIPGGGRTNITFAASATNTPTITIASANQTIANLFMDDNTLSRDGLGIRVSGSAFSYSSGASSSWTGAGILNKPIGDFFGGRTYNNWKIGIAAPRFAADSQGSVRIVVNSQFIPEPEQYALVFGLFALGFVIARRHFQKK